MSWQRSFQRVIQFLFHAKCCRCRFVSHLDEIPDREIGKRIGVLFSATKIFAECVLAVFGEFFKTVVQHHAIFERSIHSLAVKRHDRVRGIAHEANLLLVKPRGAPNGHQ